jgi:WD40 repeat protein
MYLSHDGQRIVTVGWQPYVRVWDVTREPEQIRWFAGDADQIFLKPAFSRDGRLLATGSWDGRVQIWDTQAEADTPFQTLHHGERIFCVAFHPYQRRLASSSFDGTVKIWDVRNPDDKRDSTPEHDTKPVATLGGHLGIVWSIAYDHQGKRLATASGYRGQGEIKIWDAK